MGSRSHFAASACLFFTIVATAAAQTPVVTDVLNAASRMPVGFPSYGIAQGALFAVVGKDLGPEQLQQASFPLPASGGIGGVSVQVAVAGATVDAIMVYVSAKELGAILPSSTPTGTGTLTVNNNGATATAPITVVASAFGIFTLGYYSAGGVQGAAAFNVGDDGSRTFNYLPPFQSAKPGQTVVINGTGLGAITGDETQSVGNEVPSGPVKVFVGTKEATIVSAGRGEWTGFPEGFPSFPIPQTIAAWDVIQFTVPDGVFGCHVSVVVQTGNFVSNLVWITVSPDGGPCVDVNTAAFGEKVTLAGTVKTGAISMLRTIARSTTNGSTVEIGSEIATANFFQFEVPVPVTVNVSDYANANLANNLNPGTCLVQTFRILTPTTTEPTPTPAPPPDPNKLVILDAGDAINLKNPAGASKQIKKNRDGGYGGGLGSSFSLPGLATTNDLFINPGVSTVDNGAGGPGVPGFKGSITLAKPVLTFDNIDQFATIDRSKGVTVKWSGGDPQGFVSVIGSSINRTATVSLIGTFACSERISAGQFTVPPYITLNMPVTASPAGQPPIGVLSLWNYAANRIDIPTLDIALFSIVLDIQKGTLFQ